MKKKADKKPKLYSGDHVLVMFEEIREWLFSIRKTQHIIIKKLDSLEKKIDRLSKRLVWVGDGKSR